MRETEGTLIPDETSFSLFCSSTCLLAFKSAAQCFGPRVFLHGSGAEAKVCGRAWLLLMARPPCPAGRYYTTSTIAEKCHYYEQ
jgi:hypothetical protein